MADQLADLLRTVGLRPSKSGDYLRMWCPFHPNPNGKTLWVSHKTGGWGCFSTRCPMHSGGELARLLQYRGSSAEVARSTVASLDLTAYERVERPKTLQDRDHSGVITEAHLALWYVDWGLASSVCADVMRNQSRYVQGAPVSTWSPGVPAEPGQVEHDCWEWLWYPLVHRAASPAALEVMDVGFDRELGLLTFPIRGPSGDLRGVARRACEDGKDYIIDGCCWGRQDPRWSFVPCPKGDTFFGWPEMVDRARSGHPLIVVEGYLDQLRLAGFGYCAVAKLGRVLTEDQATLLNDLPGAKILWPDFDRDGLYGVKTDIRKLRSGVRIVSDFGGLKDAGSAHMTSEVVNRSILSALHPVDWLCEFPNLIASTPQMMQ